LEIFYGHLVYFSPVLVCCTKKNLATLLWFDDDKVISMNFNFAQFIRHRRKQTLEVKI
jgi:hypothetical protein